MKNSQPLWLGSPGDYKGTHRKPESQGLNSNQIQALHVTFDKLQTRKVKEFVEGQIILYS